MIYDQDNDNEHVYDAHRRYGQRLRESKRERYEQARQELKNESELIKTLEQIRSLPEIETDFGD